MPVFSFEKLSPPVARESFPGPAASVRQHRGIIVQMLDRLTEARMRRSVRDSLTNDLAHEEGMVLKPGLIKD